MQRLGYKVTILSFRMSLVHCASEARIHNATFFHYEAGASCDFRQTTSSEYRELVEFLPATGRAVYFHKSVVDKTFLGYYLNSILFPILFQ